MTHEGSWIPCWHFSEIHKGGNDDSDATFASLKIQEQTGNYSSCIQETSLKMQQMFVFFFLLWAHPAVYYHHVEGVGIEPALHGFADGADLIQRRSVHVWPACIQRLKTQEWDTARQKWRPTFICSPNIPWGSFLWGRAFSQTGWWSRGQQRPWTMTPDFRNYSPRFQSSRKPINTDINTACRLRRQVRHELRHWPGNCLHAWTWASAWHPSNCESRSPRSSPGGRTRRWCALWYTSGPAHIPPPLWISRRPVKTK